ncbi:MULTISPECIES: SCO family protein [Bacillus]|uniref:Cysteine ABC transporter ATP-binding protein n=2 Tax=Bacillus TaxID=1386 RepID=A0A0M4G871_9BACI|nr:cysteine ABC transporter ATP-binding protein [Bacillus gobiensis]
MGIMLLIKRSVFILAGLIFILSGCGTEKIDNPLNYQLENFSYTNQENDKVSLEDLKGKVWVANFIFTSCETVCPPMTSHMTELQKRAKEENLDVHFVSFSVDPEVDTPEKLKDFSSNYPLSLKNWDFLTGYSQKEIEKFALENFKAIVQKPEDEDQVIHQTYFYLIDADGKVLKDYEGFKEVPYDRIVKDIKIVQK